MSSLIIFHLPKTITADSLREIFSQKGKVLSVQIIFTIDKENCYFALIVYETEDEAKTALNYFDKTVLFSSHISVERCEIDDKSKQQFMIKNRSDKQYLNKYEKFLSKNNYQRFNADIESEFGDKSEHQENKEDNNDYHNSRNEEEEEEEESVVPKPKEILQQPEKKQNNGLQPEPVEVVKTPKLPSYLEKLPYEEGQWSYINQTGKRVYSIAFLTQFGNEAVCQKKPEVLSSWVNITKLSNTPQLGSLGGMVPNLPRSQSDSGFMPVNIKPGKRQHNFPTIDVIMNVQTILNKITPENVGPLTKCFKALPIDTIDQLEKTVDLVFEKAIEEQSFAPLYASLCSDMQSVQVSSEDNKTMSFKKLIISKCQSLFELDKAQEMDSAKKLAKITSCKDPDKKKELLLEYEENERRLRKRSVGNCRFIGELFKQKILTPNVMLYCIVNLVTKHEEEPLECLCNLLKTVGKELEQSYNLNETFDKLKALTSKDMKSKIPSRIKFMIQDVIDLRRDKWIPRRNESKPKLINEVENDAKNEAMEQSMALSYNRSDKRDHHRGDDRSRGGDDRSRGGDNKSRHTNFPPHTVQATNSSGRFNIIGPQQAQRHYGNPSTHNISDMKSNHMANISQMQITHIPQRQPTLPHHIRPNAPRNLPRGPFQYQVYLPGNVAYSGTPNHAYYPHTAFGPQASQAVIMSPYLQNYPGNQGFIYSTTPPRPLQQMTTSIPQGPQNTPVPNMSNAQSSHGPPLIVQSQSMEMSTNSQPLQVTQQPPTTPMPIPEPRAPRRKTAAIKIIDPNTGNEIDLNNTSTTPDVIMNVQTILNKITPENVGPLTKCFKALPIDTIDQLEKTVDLVFEKAIEEQSFAPLYASLCSHMQSVQVSSEDNKTMSFKKLIISKCQSLFELDKAQEMDSAKKLAKITSCKDPDKKKELLLEYEENERRLRKRSVGNCRFIGELFKQKILTPNIILYCIVNLVTKHEEEPLECLCNLLKTVGKELEQSYNLNETFDKLKALTSKDMKSKIPSRIKFMIQDVIDLRRDKWIPRRNESKPKLINEVENDAKNEAMEQSMALSYNRSDKRDHHRGDDRSRGGDDRSRGGDNKSRRGNDSNEWNVVQNTAKYKQQNYTIDQSILQEFKESSSVTTLGPSSKWSFSSNSTGGKSSAFTSNNTYAVLNDDKKSTNTSQMMSSKNNSRKPVIYESEERQRMMSGVASMMPQFAQTSPSLSSSIPSTTVTKEAPEEQPILDPELATKISLQCKNIIQEYEQMHNLDDIVYLLTEDENSNIRTRHEEFVKSMSLITLDSKPNSRTAAGKILAELLSKKVLSMAVITHGIDAVLKDWNDYLMDYPQFFSYIAAIIAPLLISKTASFDFNNLKDACTSIRPDNSSAFFIEVLQTILSSKETQNIKEQVGGILWIYNKWRMSEYVPLDVFMPNNQINKYFKNDRVGVFLLSVAMYDKMRLTENSKLLYDNMHSWISTNINAEIIKCPQFVRALTIAIVIACLKPNHSYEDFFDHVHVKLLTCYIRSEPLPEPEIQAREVQCLYGIQIMSAALEHPGGMVLKLFHKLYQDSVISKESFDLWKKEDEFKTGFNEDLETKTMAVVVLNSFFLSLYN